MHAAVLEGSWALKRSVGAGSVGAAAEGLGEGLALDDAFVMRQESGEGYVDFAFGLADSPRAAALCARSRLLVEAAVGGGPAVLRLSVALWALPDEPMPHLPHDASPHLPHVLLGTVDVDVAKLARLVEGG